MPIAINPSITYCTHRPARMIAVMREDTMVTFLLNQSSATTVSHSMMPLAILKAAPVMLR